MTAATVFASLTFGATHVVHADPACKQGAYVLFARGSGTPFGSAQATSFRENVKAALHNRGISSVEWAELGNMDGQPGVDADGYPAVPVVDYHALPPFYGNSVEIGRNELVAHLNDRYAGDGPTGSGSCSKEVLVLGGYSQGADVVGWALRSSDLSQAAKDHIGFVALYGDPKFDAGPLGDRVGQSNFNSNWWWVRGDDWGYRLRPVGYMFMPSSGILGARSPYVPGEFKGRLGSWCAAFDVVCSGWLFGLLIHNQAYQNTWIPRSADEIAYVAKLKYNQLNYGGSAASVQTYVTSPPAVAEPKPWVDGSYITTDSTRIALPSGQQYIWQRGVTIPVSFSDAQRYDAEGNSLQSGNSGWNGPMNTVPLPPNTVFRPVGSNQQYLWSSGGQKLPIGDPATSACYFFSFPTSNPTGVPAVVPADWASTLPTGAQGNCSLGDGIRFTQGDTGSQQYISNRGAAFPVSYGDAQAYDSESNPFLGLNMPAGYVSNPVHAPNLPVNTVLRGAGSTEQFLWDGNVLHPIQNMGTAACLMIGFPQNGVALMPPSWMYNRAQGAPAACSLADGTRFTQTSYSGQQQYISIRGAVLPLSTDDAVAYDQAGNTRVIDMPSGYVEAHSAQLLANVVLRSVTGAEQFLWNGSVLHPIPNMGTSACLLLAHPQAVATLPPSWMSNRQQGSTAQCNLADGVRFTEQGYSGNAQYISMRGAALPVNTSDAQWYDGNGNGTVIDMPVGYVGTHPSTLPGSTILRPTGDSRVYLWDGTQLHYVPDSATYNCLFGMYPQNGLANVPATWVASLPVGANQGCN